MSTYSNSIAVLRSGIDEPCLYIRLVEDLFAVVWSDLLVCVLRAEENVLGFMQTVVLI